MKDDCSYDCGEDYDVLTHVRYQEKCLAHSKSSVLAIFRGFLSLGYFMGQCPSLRFSSQTPINNPSHGVTNT